MFTTYDLEVSRAALPCFFVYDVNTSKLLTQLINFNELPHEFNETGICGGEERTLVDSVVQLVTLKTVMYGS